MFSVLGASQVCVPGLSLSECVWDTQNQCAHVDSVDDRGTNTEFSSGDHKTRSHSNQLTLKSTNAIFNYMVTFEWKLWLNSTENFFSAAFLINCWWSRLSLHCLLSCAALSRKSSGKNVDLKKKTVNNIRPRKPWVLVKNTWTKGETLVCCVSVHYIVLGNVSATGVLLDYLFTWEGLKLRCILLITRLRLSFWFPLWIKFLNNRRLQISTGQNRHHLTFTLTF